MADPTTPPRPEPAGSTVSRTGFIVGEAALILLAQAFGGPPWTIVAMVALVGLSVTAPAPASLALAAPSLAWLGLSHATGNRELFFPFAMHLAAAVICRAGSWRAAAGSLAGLAVVVAFFGVRIWQQATPRVLAVEAAVATAIVLGVVAARRLLPRHPVAEAAIVAAAAVAAYAGLAL